MSDPIAYGTIKCGYCMGENGNHFAHCHRPPECRTTQPGVPIIKCAMCNRSMFDGHATITPMPQPLTITREQWRWWFAGQAMNLAYDHYRNNGDKSDPDFEWSRDVELMAADAREYADALLAELERTAP